MCLTVANGNLEPLIAKEDIIVFKIGTAGVEYKFFNLFKKYWFRPEVYSSFEYVRNKKNPKVELKPVKESNRYVIYEGYHAYTSYSRAYNMKCGNSIIARFKIPKGSLYYKGINGDVASNQIIYLGIVKPYNPNV